MKKLDRQQMKNLKGGTNASGGCSMTYQDSQGNWHTETGSCDEQITGNWASAIATPYCHTASFSGPTTVNSNGGVSRCGAPYLMYGPPF